MLNTRINDTNSVESDNAIEIHYTYENTYTDENRKKNNIEIGIAVLLPARLAAWWQFQQGSVAGVQLQTPHLQISVKNEDT
jgi:hypothetical protein